MNILNDAISIMLDTITKRLIVLNLVFLLAGCASVSEQQPLPVEHNWASPVSEETQAYIQSATQQYHLCLTRATNEQVGDIKDSRDTTQVIITACEAKLAPIRERLMAENMPAPIADRYLRRKRVQATRQVLRQVMFMQSQNPS